MKGSEVLLEFCENKLTFLPYPSLEAAAYLRLQGYWGNQARIRGLLGVGTQGTPYQNLKSLRIRPTFFGSDHILCAKHRT